MSQPSRRIWRSRRRSIRHLSSCNLANAVGGVFFFRAFAPRISIADNNRQLGASLITRRLSIANALRTLENAAAMLFVFCRARGNEARSRLRQRAGEQSARARGSSCTRSNALAASRASSHRPALGDRRLVTRTPPPPPSCRHFKFEFLTRTQIAKYIFLLTPRPPSLSASASGRAQAIDRRFVFSCKSFDNAQCAPLPVDAGR